MYLIPLVFVVSFLALRWALVSGRAGRWAIDLPNERSLHAQPTPRVGGAITLPWALLAGLVVGDGLRFTLTLACVLVVLSFFDDRRGLPVGVRLGGHVLAASVFTVATLATPWYVLLVVVLAIGWLTNLYNFMDGADGLAGSMTVTGFGAYALAAWLADDIALTIVAGSIIASNLAFLAYNHPPARIFMGDTGSIPLGFLAGAIGVAGWGRGLWPVWFPLLAFSPFIVDASVTLLRRGLRGEKVWRAHREHAYQRLVRSGWSHRQLLLAAIPLMVGAAGTAVALRDAEPGRVLAGLAAWAVAYLAIGLAVERRWRRALAPADRSA